MSDEATTNTLTEIIRLQEQSKAVSEKLTQQGNDIHALRNELQKSQAPDLVATRTKLNVFESKLDEIAKDLKASQKPNWGLYISFALLLWTVGGGIGFGFWTVQNAKIEMKLDTQVFKEWREAEERRGVEQDNKIRALEQDSKSRSAGPQGLPAR